MKKPKSLITFPDVAALAKWLGVPSEPPEFEPVGVDQEEYARLIAEAVEDGAPAPEEVVETVLANYEQEQFDEIDKKHRGAVEWIADSLFANFAMAIVPLVKRPESFRVVSFDPYVSVQQLLAVINGVGLCYAGTTVAEFMEIGPYSSYWGALKANLAWVRRYYDVYGGASLESQYWRQME